MSASLSSRLYLGLTVAGLVVPYAPFVAWLLDHGVDPALLLEEVTANRISTFFALDVVVSVVVIWAFIAIETTRREVQARWAPVAGTLLVGASFGLPLYLYLRERGARGG